MRPRAPLLLVLLLLAGGGASAQEPDSLPPAQDTLPRDTLAQDTLAQDTLAQDTLAQDSVPAEAAPFVYRPPRLALRVGAGAPGFGTLQSQPVRVQRLDATGAALEEGVITRALELDGGVEATASAVLSLSRRWAVRVGASWSRATLRTAYTAGDTVLTGLAAVAAPGQDIETTALGGEAALRLRLPSSRRIQPFIELGALILRWSADGSVAGAEALADGVARVGGLAALGAVVPLGERFALHVQASNRVFRTPVDAARARTPGPTTRPLVGVRTGGPTVALSYEPVESTAWADTGHTLTSALRFEVGLSLGFGAEAPAPRDPAAPAASTPPPGR